MDLFDASLKDRLEHSQPLAARLRPRNLDEYIGQDHILGPGRLLRRAIQADQLSSLIFYGPPGTGKTTLATVIANTTRSHFIAINAVLAGVAQIRQAIDQAQDRHKFHDQRTILFVDEVHRFNKAQQDALLPWVENGTVILIGATTENPYFSVNRPLLSRSRIFQLKSLTNDDVATILQHALKDHRGYGHLQVALHPDALDHLVNVANGDARAALNALELAVETTPPGQDKVIAVGLEVAEESIQRRAVLYDKEGDYHFDIISAFIKSLRGSDPDAALYWMARMVYAGEDPNFILRRMLIFASEDVGLADPNALQVITAAATAFDRVGLPEGRFPLAQAALYLATAPKSNSALAFFDALNAVEKEQEDEVPNHLKDASRDSEGFGHGANYLYPHAYRDHWVAQQYLPTSLQGRIFYQPSDQGYEQNLAQELMRRREVQLAAMAEGNGTPAEVLSFSPPDKRRDQWLERTVGEAAPRLDQVRQQVFAGLRLQRHFRILDLGSPGGLFTWEALRRVPEGGVWSLCPDKRAVAELTDFAQHLNPLERPTPLQGVLGNRLNIEAELRFEALVGYRVLGGIEDKSAAIKGLAGLLTTGGQLSLIEGLPQRGQRLYKLLPDNTLPQDLHRRLAAAEEGIYTAAHNPKTNWTPTELETHLAASGLTRISHQIETMRFTRQIPSQQLAHWFAPGDATNRTYAYQLQDHLVRGEIEIVEQAFQRLFSNNRKVPWEMAQIHLVAEAP